MRKFKDLLHIVGVLAVLLTFFLVPTTVLAATSATVTVNATPGYISMTVAPLSWDVNGITGSGVISTNTVYYSNPLGDTLIPSNPIVDGECLFTITNTASVATNITANWSDFANGDAMANSNTGNEGAATFGGYSWNSGDTTYAGNRTVAMTATSGYMHTNLAGTTNLKFGLTIRTQTNAWTSGTTMESTVTVVMTQAY